MHFCIAAATVGSFVRPNNAAAVQVVEQAVSQSGRVAPRFPDEYHGLRSGTDIYPVRDGLGVRASGECRCVPA